MNMARALWRALVNSRGQTTEVQARGVVPSRYRLRVEQLEERELLAADSLGTDFWLTFPENGGGSPTLRVYITGPNNTTGTVTIPGLAFSAPFSVTANVVTTVSIPFTAHLTSNDLVENKGIHIVAAAEVSVYGMNQVTYTTDAFLGLPTDILGQEYFVQGFQSNQSGYATELAVVATVNNTNVTITPSVTTGSHLAGVPYTIALNQGQTYQLQNTVNNRDLSGTLITSDNPIAVFGANECCNIPSPIYYACDHIVEEMTPTSTWGQNFVTMPLATRIGGDTFRILAATNGTQVRVNGSVVATLNRGQFHQQLIVGAAQITASSPVLVAQYSNSTDFDGVTSDPFMMLIPPQEQFLGSYTVTTPATGFLTNFINVVAPTTAVGSITRNGVPIPAASFTPIGSTGFSGAQVAITLGSHTLAGAQAFGVFVYGFASADSYGYPGGLSLAPVALVSSINLTPATDVKPIATGETLTATVLDTNSLPLAGIRVDFTVTGANPQTSFAFTDAAGQAVFTYTGTNGGTDTVQASVGSFTDSSTITWNSGGVNVSPSTLNLTEGAAGSYALNLLSAPTADVTINFAAGAGLSLSASSLTFTSANWNTPQTVTVTATNDAIAQGNRAPIITQTITTTDAVYNVVSVASVTVNITEDDSAGISASVSSVPLSEGGTFNTYTLQLTSQPTANVVVAVSAPGNQVSLSVATLVFQPSNWNVPQSVDVIALDDTIAEGTHTNVITNRTTSLDAAYTGLTSLVTATISDNDTSSVILSGGALTLLEGTSRSLTAILNSQPLADVVVTFAGDGQVAVSPSTVTFTAADWNAPRPLLVTAVEDGDVENSHTGSFTTSASSTDAQYNFALGATMANIVDNDGAANFGTAGNDVISITFVSGKGTLILNGKSTALPSSLTELNLITGGGNDTVQITNPTIPISISGGNGTDKVIVTGLTTANSFVVDTSSVSVNGVSVSAWDVENVTANGKAGNDSFTVLNMPGFAVDLKGDAGTDRILGPAQNSTWNITGTALGKLNGTIAINGVENWTGGAGNDTFAFAAGKVLGGVIDGGAGTNALDWSAYTGAVTANVQTGSATGVKSFLSINKFVGGKSTADKLIAANQANTWNVATVNAGTVNSVSFLNVENLTGGSLADTFILADNTGVKGKIDGGGGSDLLDFTAYLSRPVTVNLQSKTATSLAGFLNVEQFQGGSGLADILIGFNKVNTWNLTGNGVGDINGTPFGNFENLTGGTLTDTYNLTNALAEWLGILNGGTGTDTIKSFTGRSNIWLGSTTGTLNGRKFASIENHF